MNLGTTLGVLNLPGGNVGFSSPCTTYNLTNDGALVLALDLKNPCFDGTAQSVSFIASFNLFFTFIIFYIYLFIYFNG